MLFLSNKTFKIYFHNIKKKKSFQPPCLCNRFDYKNNVLFSYLFCCPLGCGTKKNTDLYVLAFINGYKVRGIVFNAISNDNKKINNCLKLKLKLELVLCENGK